VRNNERYSVFSLAVSQAFLEVSDLRSLFLPFHLQYSSMLECILLNLVDLQLYPGTKFRSRSKF
jgi:hypothetical protein